MKQTYTARQHQVLDFIRTTMEERGIAPTLGEIGDELGGITRVAVLDHLRALQKKGAICRRARESRAIEILDERYTPAVGIPIEGVISAGDPILEVNDRESVTLEGYLGVDDESFLLRVRGDSMIDDHICDGDLVLIERARTARNGDIVVAVLDDEVTLKRMYREKSRVRLQPANSKMKARYVPAKSLRIRGVMRGVIRRT